MKLVEARKVLANSVLSVDQVVYGDEKLDRAIKFAFQIFLRRTRCDTESADFTMAVDSATQDVTESVTPDFLPYQVIAARINFKQVELRNTKDLLRNLDGSTATGRPTMIAWESKDVALVYPIPDLAYTLHLTRTSPLVAFDPGTEQEITINIPEPFVHDAIWFGAGPALVYGESGSLYASEGWRRFELLIKEVAGISRMGVGATYKENPSSSFVNWRTEGAAFSTW